MTPSQLSTPSGPVAPGGLAGCQSQHAHHVSAEPSRMGRLPCCLGMPPLQDPGP